MPSLPYFPFYGQDWLGDSKVRRMSHEQRGVHIDLLCHAWDAGSIPADESERAHILGITPRRLASLWSKVEPCWESDGNGGLVNPKMERVRAKQRARQTAGKAGANGEQKGSES